MTKRLGCLLVFILLASCGGQVKDGPPRRDVDVSKIPDAVPKHEPITRAGNKSPYRVLGKTYYVLPSFKNYRARGLASWYGTKFHGNSTSNGEPYDMYGMTAAHKTLPIPCYVQVTNLQNGRTAIVRVNDRGPFHDDRIIDLSYAAAKKLGVHATGTAQVEVVAIDPASYRPGMDLNAVASASSVPEPSPPLAGNSAFLQIGAFSTKGAAANYQQSRLGGFDYPSEVRQSYTGGRTLYKVLIGPFVDHNSLVNAQNLLRRKQNLTSYIFYE